MTRVKWNRHETLTYVLLWSALIIAPVLSQYINSSHSNEQTFSWADVLFVWRQYILFFVIFLIHNFLLAPLLVERRQRVAYFSSIVALVAVFVLVQCSSRPTEPGSDPVPELREPPMAVGHDMNDMNDMPPGPPHGMHRPPLIYGQHDVIATIMLVLMLGMNIGIKLYFRGRRNDQRLETLEHENLENQLEFLKYQINPHFLMNTLNNIHALVDIEPEQAKETIVELSKIMRFVLYEGSKQKVPLGRELQFLENYINLMRMRLTDKVKLSVELPDHVPDSEVPPLLFITFVENAFKHGVSYSQPSFIDISISISDGTLHFNCVNSKVPRTADATGGIGLQNAQRRLDLIYGSDYTLDINDDEKTYTIDLTIKLT